MSSYQELVSVLKEILTNRFYPKPEFIKGLLGDGLGNVVVPGRPDFNYVRFNRSANETFEVFNKEVSQPVDGTPCLIGVLPWQPGLVQVVGIDWESYIQTSWGNNYASIQAHAPTHEWPDFIPGSDYMRVFARAIYPLQGYGGGTGSMSFTAYPYQYDYTGTNSYWPGTPAVSLGPTRPPTGTMRYMGVYLNPATNQLGVVTGASVTFAADGEPPYPAWPLNVYPVAYARVYGGQAYFVERDIKDARRLWNTTVLYTGTSLVGGIVEASWYDYPLIDTANVSGVASHFRDNAASYPGGWTQADAPADVNTTNKYSFWFIAGTSGNAAWDYRRQTSINLESQAASAATTFMVGPILLKDGRFTADVNYYFGIYRNNAGAIDTETYSRMRIWWDSATSLWKVVGEEKDGTTAHSTTVTLGQQNPLVPLYIAFTVINVAGKTTRQLFGAGPVIGTMQTIQSIPTSAPTWGQMWVRFHQTRGAGLTDVIRIGALDYLGNVVE